MARNNEHVCGNDGSLTTRESWAAAKEKMPHNKKTIGKAKNRLNIETLPLGRPQLILSDWVLFPRKAYCLSRTVPICVTTRSKGSTPRRRDSPMSYDREERCNPLSGML